MKQLLDTTRDSYLIFGLNDRVFVGRYTKCSGSAVGEQNCHVVGNRDNGNRADHGASSEQQQHRAILYELDLCKERIDLASAPLPEEAESAASRAGGSSCLGNQGNKQHAYQVQAVAISKARNVLVCGVACHNKSLLLYEIDLGIAARGAASVVVAGGAQQRITRITVTPKASHTTFKRCCCLCFAVVPADRRVGGSESGCLDGDEEDVCDGLLTLVAGDLTGDAVAFPCQAVEAAVVGDEVSVRLDAAKPSAVSSESSGLAGADNARDVSSDCRLLLGHTASMLTGVRVVATHDDSGRTKCRILTSDRDEKVRVSSFPDAFRIEGYLLGHDAFISALDVANDDTGHGTPRCVTCSGDGTVRLWDLVQFQEVARYFPENDLVPSRVAITSTGDTVAVIYDESPRLDILRVTDGTDVEFRLDSTFDLPSSALSLSWLDGDTEDGSVGNGPATLIALLTKSPFVQVLQLDVSSKALVPVSTSPMVSALSNALAGETVCMPSSVLEKDQAGKLTMTKNRERRRPGALERPWNNPERKQIAKEREKRYKKAKHRVEENDDCGTHKPS
jgi:hypothetical protein